MPAPSTDSLVHEYRFTAFALDVESVPVEGKFTAQDVLSAIEGHVLEEASLLGKYTINLDAHEG